MILNFDCVCLYIILYILLMIPSDGLVSIE